MKEPSYLNGGRILISLIVVVILISVSGAFGYWLSVGLLSLGGLYLLCSLISQIRKSIVSHTGRIYTKAFSLKFIATLMGFFLVSGTLLYFFVFHTIGIDSLDKKVYGNIVNFCNAEYLFRSLICSLDLFMLDVDTNILDRLDSHEYLKGWMSVLAVLSFSCTVAMLVRLVYSRLIAYCRLNFLTKIDNNRNHLYLFFGNNEASEILIKEIIKNDKDKEPVAIIIDTANVNDDDNDEWQGIVGLLTHRQKVFHTAEKIGAQVAIASQQLNDIDDEISSRDDFDAFGYLGIPRIKKYIDQLAETDNPQLHIFFMGDDEELNIRNITTLAKDRTIMSVAEKQIKSDAEKKEKFNHCIYCHARYNGPNRVIEDLALKKKLNIKIVDSSHIAVELLKQDSTCHPVNVVRTSEKYPTTVESPLKTMIIGFGEVGRDAFRFLYEFGAFVNSNNLDERSPFECVIVDRNLDEIKGTFMASMPGIFKPDGKGGLGNPSIQFENTDYNSADFYARILYKEHFLEEIKYIVISIGDNDEAIALAARLFNQIRRVRKDLSDLRIFVRCTDSNKVKGIERIADHYNFGYGKGKDNTPVIHIFGQPDKTYTYDLVVSDRLVKEGKIFHEKYLLFSGEKETWDNRHQKLTETGDIDQLRKLRRKESQDKANALHTGKKVFLLKNAMNRIASENGAKPDWNLFIKNYFNADGSSTVTGKRKEIHSSSLTHLENETILHLAMLEHIRWNAAHELMGYIFYEGGNECDERTMKHNCLCSWSRLDQQSDMVTDWDCDYKKFDFCVVDTTISLNTKKLVNNND